MKILTTYSFRLGSQGCPVVVSMSGSSESGTTLCECSLSPESSFSLFFWISSPCIIVTIKFITSMSIMKVQINLYCALGVQRAWTWNITSSCMRDMFDTVPLLETHCTHDRAYDIRAETSMPSVDFQNRTHDFHTWSGQDLGFDDSL